MRVAQHRYDGTVVAEHAADVRIDPRSAASVDVPDGWPRDAGTFVVAETDGTAAGDATRAFWWFAPDKAGHAPRPEFDVKVSDDSKSVTVTAKTLLRDVCLFPDRLHADAVASDACMTLLPGESFRFDVESPVPLDADRLKQPPVLRCVGDR